MLRNLYPWVLAVLLVLIISAAPLCAAEEEDQCSEEGITVRNATMLDLWYKSDGGECVIWIHEHLFTIRPEDSVEIYSDMDCQTLYCEDNPTYADYRAVDANGDCWINIYPDCDVSDK